MRLDRNINSNERGKYALLNLRTNQVQWGNTADEEFFVIKLKDRFAAAALFSYAIAVDDAVAALRAKADGSITAIANQCIGEAMELEEYSAEIRVLAARACDHPNKKTPD